MENPIFYNDKDWSSDTLTGIFYLIFAYVV